MGLSQVVEEPHIQAGMDVLVRPKHWAVVQVPVNNDLKEKVCRWGRNLVLAAEEGTSLAPGSSLWEDRGGG